MSFKKTGTSPILGPVEKPPTSPTPKKEEENKETKNKNKKS